MLLCLRDMYKVWRRLSFELGRGNLIEDQCVIDYVKELGEYPIILKRL
jgi:hypothetical protein